MGDPYKGRLAGHSLRIARIGNTGFSPCQSMCECGASMGKLSSGKQAREWHQKHKAEVLDSWVANGCDDKGREIHL